MVDVRKLTLVGIAACVWCQAGERKQVSLGAPAPMAELPAAPGKAISVGYLEDGSRWIMTAEDVSRGFHRLYLTRPGNAQTTTVFLDEAMRAAGGQCQLVPRLSVDAQGQAWLPVACRQGRELRFALIRAVGDGGATTVLALNPPVEARSVAVGRDGTLFVLGVEAGFFRGTAAECHLVHHYTATGERIRSFSPCPASGVAGVGPSRRDGVDYEEIKQETDHGKVWVDGSNIRHLLPQAGELRTYSAEGVLIRTLSFERPGASLKAPYVIHALFPLRDGRFLVFWRSGVREGNLVRASVGAALHDSEGRMLSALAGPERFGGLSPAYLNAKGELVFQRLEAGTGRITLWKAEVLLN